MKKIFLTLATFASIAVSSAQTPEGINYQAVVRDVSGNVLANQNVSYRISILQGDINGNVVYSETHTLPTNDFGLTNFRIGEGTVVSGAFQMIDWGADSYFVQIELDENGGGNYTTMGTSQLMSVPYALHAKTAENVFSGDYNDLSNQPTIPSNVSELANDAGYLTNPNDADADPANELQALSISGNDLTISAGNTVSLPQTFSGDYNDLTNQPAIPSNVSELANDAGYLTNPDDADADPANELQTLSISGNDLTISGGNTILLPQNTDNDWVENGPYVYNLISDIGIGTANPAARLDVVGDFKVTDGSQGDGKVMVSDMNGQTTWGNSMFAKSSGLNNVSTDIDNTWTPVGPAITFTKTYDNTVLEVSLASRVYGGVFSGALGAKFQLMVDGNPANYNQEGTILQSGSTQFLSFNAYFTTLPAGTYSVQVHAQTNTGTSTGVILDPGGWGGRILIKEGF